MDSGNEVTLVIGLGEVGRPLFNALSGSDGNIIGVDKEVVPVQQKVNLMHVCYPFDIPDGFVDTTSHYATDYRPEVIVINSTVLPGTTREIQDKTRIPCVYSPVRGKHTKMESELKHYVKFLGGTDETAVQRAEDSFRKAGMRTRIMATPETAELAKLLETTYFAVLIGWAQEMERFAKSVGADYMEVTEFFKEVSYLPSYIFQPGYIGGHCLMSNIGVLQRRFRSDFLNAVVASNDKKAMELDSTALKSDKRLQPIEVSR